jgi:hypothetical protein
MAVVLMALVVVLGIVAILTDDYSMEGAVRPLALGLTGAVALTLLVRQAMRMTIPRLYFTAAALAAATLWSVFASASFSEGLGVMWMVLGASAVLTGSLTLGRYLRSHPKRAAEPS